MGQKKDVLLSQAARLEDKKMYIGTKEILKSI